MLAVWLLYNAISAAVAGIDRAPRAAEADAILRGVLAPDAPARAREGAAPPATR